MDLPVLPHDDKSFQGGCICIVQMEQYSDIIIGGGPAGLFCAQSIGYPDKKVLIIEKKSQCGLKLLISGSGQCNITHDGEITDFFSHYGDNGKFLKPALMNFSNRDLISFFVEQGLTFSSEPGGKMFPSSRKSREILEVLLRRCSENGVEIRCNEHIESVRKVDAGFQVITRKGTYSTRTLVIATGGVTYPSTGSTGEGLKFSELLGHPVTETGPALTGIYPEKYPFSDLSGISLADIQLSLFRKGRKIRQHTGDILFTHTGLSGPGVLDLSRYVRPGDTLHISFLTGHEIQTVPDMLIHQFSMAGKRQVKTVLSGLGLPERLIKKLLEIAEINPETTASHLAKKDRNTIFRFLTAFSVHISGLFDIHEAMVTRGGASVTDINPKTMESRIVPGLFFAGEVMDIDGDCGGYNLQAAFSTGFLAAQGIDGYHRCNDPETIHNPHE